MNPNPKACIALVTEKPLEVCKDHYLLKINIKQNYSAPGQFVNIKIGDLEPLLRRPFSIYNQNSNTIEIIFRIVGKGTKLLKDIKAQSLLDVIGPLGHGFSIAENKSVLLIGGGVGNAPLYYLARTLNTGNNKIHYIYAARSKEFIFNKNDFKAIADMFYLYTDNGSEGQKGTAGDAAAAILQQNKFDIIYTCGPSVMMKAIAGIAKQSDTPIEASLENYFGCGIGLCFGCAVETISGIKRACVDGPVFDGRIVNWDSLLK
ncbi:MAG: dihydroorotate dehydrogenase electron transfer subunit [Spirochaetota bacterium]